MIISDPTMYVESMQGSVVDLSCSLQQIPLLSSVKTALLQYLSYSFLFSSSANLSLTFFVCSCFDLSHLKLCGNQVLYLSEVHLSYLCSFYCFFGLLGFFMYLQ